MSIQTKTKVFDAAESRGLADHGWLISRHTFSFAGYYNPDRIHFGALRVLNDDIVKPGQGFGTHPHDNMEIISIPLHGSLAHRDSTGNEKEIKTGEVQIISAGSGLQHSEYNYSHEHDVNFLQIWILPKEKNIAPRYDQIDFSNQLNKNEMVTVVSSKKEGALWINQDAELSMGKLEKGQELVHEVNYKGNGIYAFLIDGAVSINNTPLKTRDAVGYFDIKKIDIKVEQDATLLLIEIPKYY